MKAKLTSIYKNYFTRTRFQLVFVFYFIFLIQNFLIRLILTSKELRLGNISYFDCFKIFPIGLYHDSINFGYLAIPLTILLIIFPHSFFNRKTKKILFYVFSFVFISIVTFQGHSEWFFWNEFTSRFNFIAVDYLIYTKEVLGNIRESYPMHLIYLSVLSISLVFIFIFYKITNKLKIQDRHLHLFTRIKIGLFLLLIPLGCFFVLENYLRDISSNKTVNELSHNGLYELFHAFRHNELDYDSFFKTLDQKKVIGFMKKELSTSSSKIEERADIPFIRHIKSSAPEIHYNVILIGVESLAASFMERFNGPKNITPFLDELSKNSLFFSNIYATGTRTVRGLEALTLSIPPTPGASIVRRNNNENLFSIGKVFRDRNYQTKFIYGGYGMFDNMNAFFSGNGFEIVDRTNFTKDEYVMANIWGVDDESLFNKVLKESDKSYRNQKKFFSFVMTTSNHRPFTYPEGRIDIPSHTSREGAVKYTDYAIHKFLKDAEKKPWFHNTLFVIVADHGVGGRGTMEIPMDQYHIPFFIYNPNFIRPREVNRLASQIDVVPTVLALLNFSYDSKFFGKNILEMKENEERAVLGSYSSLGYYSKGTLVTLGLNKSVNYNTYDPKTLKLSPTSNKDLTTLDEAISYYQHASFLWKQGLYKEKIDIK